jgi:hypothetical protein
MGKLGFMPIPMKLQEHAVILARKLSLKLLVSTQSQIQILLELSPSSIFLLTLSSQIVDTWG